MAIPIALDNGKGNDIWTEVVQHLASVVCEVCIADLNPGLGCCVGACGSQHSKPLPLARQLACTRCHPIGELLCKEREAVVCAKAKI